jgi:DNA-binding IscR family transcriptional regulator
MLYNYRLKNNKDYYKCELGQIITAFEECIASIKCVEYADKNNENKVVKYKITYYEELLKTTLNNINLSTIV